MIFFWIGRAKFKSKNCNPCSESSGIINSLIRRSDVFAVIHALLGKFCLEKHCLCTVLKHFPWLIPCSSLQSSSIAFVIQNHLKVSCQWVGSFQEVT